MTEPSFQPPPTDSAAAANADFAVNPAGLAAFVQSYWTPAGRQAAWNLGWLMAGTGVSQACGLASVLVLTTALGPQRFGIYAFSMALYGYMMLIGMAGMEPVVIRETTRRPHALDRLVGAYMSISLTAALLVSGLTWGLAQFAGTSADERFLIGCIALANLATCGLLFAFLDAHHRQAGAAVTAARVKPKRSRRVCDCTSKICRAANLDYPPTRRPEQATGSHAGTSAAFHTFISRPRVFQRGLGCTVPAKVCATLFRPT